MGNHDLRIMMIEPLGDGGIAHYTYNLLNALSKQGVEAILFTNVNYEFKNEDVNFQVCNQMFRLANWLIGKFSHLDQESGPLSVLRRVIKVMEYPLNVLEALCLMEAKRIKIVHLQSVNLIEMLMIVACRLMNKKVLYTIHNVMPKHKKLKFYHVVLFWAMYVLCHQIIIHTEKGKEEIIELYGVYAKKIHVIPHGDYRFFVPDRILSKVESKRKLDVDVRSKTILFFGAIRESKGLDLILFALPIIKRRLPGVKLLVVGEPWEDWGKYEKIIKGLLLEENVFLKLEYIPSADIPEYFFAADIVVLPYRTITGSGVLQIAYAFGKPVVATALPGFQEVVIDGENGFLVPLDESEMFAERVLEVLLNDALLKQMGHVSLQLSTRNSWDEIALMTINLYSSVTEEVH